MREADTRMLSTASGTENRDRETHHHYHGCCTGLPGLGPRATALLWGAGLLAIGVVWLVANASGIEEWGRWLTPILLLGIGLAILVATRPE